MVVVWGLMIGWLCYIKLDWSRSMIAYALISFDTWVQCHPSYIDVGYTNYWKLLCKRESFIKCVDALPYEEPLRLVYCLKLVRFDVKTWPLLQHKCHLTKILKLTLVSSSLKSPNVLASPPCMSLGELSLLYCSCLNIWVIHEGLSQKKQYLVQSYVIPWLMWVQGLGLV